jgi:peptidyl-prolyl cis-trans isomerase D
MLGFFRRLSKTKVGTGIIAGLFFLTIVGFAATGVTNFGSGNLLSGMGSSTLAKVGNQEITDREMSDRMQRHLQDVRQQNPQAEYATITGDFEPLLNEMIDERTILAFADKYGFRLSKRLIDAQIAQIPQAKGLNGQVSEQSYQQFLARQHLTDAQVRELIAGSMLERMLLTPVGANAHVSVGMATPYASMLLEARQGEALPVPIDVFKAGLKPTDAEIQQFYAANRAEYLVPEQRMLRLATIGSEAVANVSASPQEIAAYYKANQATYGTNETRDLSQVVVPDQATANAIAARAKGGASLAAAAAPAGSNAAVTTLAAQTRQAYSSVAGDKVAAAVFTAPAGGLVGPLHSDFGWVVAKVDSVKSEGGKTLAQATPEIAAKLNVDKRKQAIEDVVDKLQNAFDNGQNFTEAVAAAKLPVTTTPLVTANGTSRTDPNFKLPQNYAPVLKTGFEMAANDPPEVVPLGADQGYVVVSPAQVIPAAPAPLANIREQVAAAWIDEQAVGRARAAANAIAAKASQGASLADAAKQSGVILPAALPLSARRIQIASANGQIPAPLRVLFSVPQGKARPIAVPQAKAFFVVKVNKVVPGNAMFQPGLIGQMQNELGRAMGEDYGREFLTAMQADIKVRRNESAIQTMKTRLASSGS